MQYLHSYKTCYIGFTWHGTCSWPDFHIRKWRWCCWSYRWQGCHTGNRISSLRFGISNREINLKFSLVWFCRNLLFQHFFWLYCKFTCATTTFVHIVQNIHSSAILIQFHTRSFSIMVHKLYRSVPGLRSILHLSFMEIRWVDFVQSCWWTNQQMWMKTWPPWQRSNT